VGKSSLLICGEKFSGRRFRNCNKTFTAEFAETAEKKNNGFGSTTPGGVVMVYPWFQFLCVLRALCGYVRDSYADSCEWRKRAGNQIIILASA
jgi:hypothetical protein